MIEYLKRKISPEITLRTYLPQITETFIEYYGEENRKIIEQKFQNILLICTQTPNGLKNKIFNLKKDYSQELIKSFFNKINLSYTEENINQIFGDNEPAFDYPNLLPIEKYKRIINDEDMPIYLKNSFIRDIKPLINLFYPNVEDIETFIKTSDLTELDKIYAIYQDIINEYNIFKKEIQPYIDYLNECKKIKKDLKRKYTLELAEKFQNCFSDKEIQDFKEKGYLSSKMLLYLGYTLEIPSIIEAFSKESQKIIDDPKSISWQVTSILNDRINFFKEMGLDLGDEYQNYQNNHKCQKIIPSQDLIKDIRSFKEDLEMRMYNDYFTSIFEYKKTRNKIDSLDLYLKDDGYNAGTFLYAGTYVTPNVKKENNSYIPFSLVNINFDNIDDFMDKRIIHELNHVYELELINVSNAGADYTCGWESFHESATPESDLYPLYEDTKKREYELFSEIINEIIAQEITEKLHEKGIYIFCDSNSAKIKGGTGYENTRFLVQTFYETFKKEILASRRGNMNYLFEACGEENFNKLNELFHIFKDKWLGFNSVKLYEDLKNKENNENTKTFYEIIDKRDEILTSMLEHKKTNNKKIRQ